MANNQNETRGNLKISDSVISTIAATAAAEVSGVAGLAPAPGIMGNLKPGDPASSIAVKLTGGTVKITVYLTVMPGKNIPVVSAAVQDAVKNAVQTMCKTVVEKVDIFVMGVKTED